MATGSVPSHGFAPARRSAVRSSRRTEASTAWQALRAAGSLKVTVVMFLAGIFLLFEDAVAVGDVVTLGGLSGTVEQLSIRSIRLRAMNGDVHIVPFSAVTTVTNQTRDYGYAVLDLVVDYEADTDLVAAALSEVGTVMRADDAWSGSIMAAIEVMGVERMNEMGVVVRARMKTEPARRWAVSRELNRRVKLRCGELGIMISPPGKVVQVPPPLPAV